MSVTLPNPNGIPPQSPGLRGTSYPGLRARKSFSNPTGVASLTGERRPCATTPLGWMYDLRRIPRVAASFNPERLSEPPLSVSVLTWLDLLTSSDTA